MASPDLHSKSRPHKCRASALEATLLLSSGVVADLKRGIVLLTPWVSSSKGDVEGGGLHEGLLLLYTGFCFCLAPEALLVLACIKARLSNLHMQLLRPISP